MKKLLIILLLISPLKAQSVWSSNNMWTPKNAINYKLNNVWLSTNLLTWPVVTQNGHYIQLTWNGSGQSYNIYRSTISGGPYKLIDSTNSFNLQ